ncbi:MAG: hypothetical protein ACI856_002838, partial [Kiritimatiellia bacterium]
AHRLHSGMAFLRQSLDHRSDLRQHLVAVKR